MPDLKKIVTPLISQDDQDRRRKDQKKQEEDTFKATKPKEDIPVIKPRVKVKK